MSTTIGVEDAQAAYERRYTTQADLHRGETRIPRLGPNERLLWGNEDAQPLTRRQALCILGIAWGCAAVALALIALGRWLG